MIRVNGVQEVALILAGIPRFVQLDAARAVHEPRVVPSREVGRTEPPHILQGHAELDLPVAQHVRIGRSACALLAQKVLEDTLPVLGGEAHPMQTDVQLVCDRARVLKILRSRAIGVVVLVPVAHEQPVHVETLLLEQQGADGGVHAA